MFFLFSLFRNQERGRGRGVRAGIFSVSDNSQNSAGADLNSVFVLFFVLFLLVLVVLVVVLVLLGVVFLVPVAVARCATFTYTKTSPRTTKTTAGKKIKNISR